MKPDHRPPARPEGPLVRLAKLWRAGALRDLTGTERDVLLSHIFYASPEGRSYPAVSTITKATGHPRGAVFKAHQRLEVLGFLVRQGRVGRRGKSEADKEGPVRYEVLPMGIVSRYVSETSTHIDGQVSKLATGQVQESIADRYRNPLSIGIENLYPDRLPESAKDKRLLNRRVASFASPSETASLAPPSNGTGTDLSVVLRTPTGRVVTLTEKIQHADTFGGVFSDAILARSLGVTVEAIRDERRKMAEQTSEALKESTTAGGNGNGSDHQTYPDQDPAEIVQPEPTGAAVGVPA